MPKTELIDKSYIKLLNDLKILLIEGLQKIEEARANTYWHTGEMISQHLLVSRQHGDGLFMRLSKDLGIGKRTLERAVTFHRLFSIEDTSLQLQWSHYRALISVQDKQKRDSFQKRAIRQNWNSKDLRKAIRIYKLQLKKLKKEPQEPIKAPKLSVTRGKLYTYRLVKPKFHFVSGTGSLMVDCGFNFQRDVGLAGLSKPEEDQIVESIKTESGYRLKAVVGFTSKDLYTYKAFVEDVVDGDTIWVNIDLGFKNWYRINLRFRGIDAPELSTQKGVRVKEFVESMLSKCPFIIIRSASLGKYGRPISDIFYLPDENDPHKVLEEGTFLNQQLLDLGFAKIMEG